MDGNIGVDKAGRNRLCISVRIISHTNLLHSAGWMGIGLRILQLPESTALVINFINTFNHGICN